VFLNGDNLENETFPTKKKINRNKKMHFNGKRSFCQVLMVSKFTVQENKRSGDHQYMVIPRGALNHAICVCFLTIRDYNNKLLGRGFPVRPLHK